MQTTSKPCELLCIIAKSSIPITICINIGSYDEISAIPYMTIYGWLCYKMKCDKAVLRQPYWILYEFSTEHLLVLFYRTHFKPVNQQDIVFHNV